MPTRQLDEEEIFVFPDAEAKKLTNKLAKFIEDTPELKHCTFYFAVAVPTDRETEDASIIPARVFANGTSHLRTANLLNATLQSSFPQLLMALYTQIQAMILKNTLDSLGSLYDNANVDDDEDSDSIVTMTDFKTIN
jgi:hypothetical protein